MRKLVLSLAFAGSLMIAATACNSTKNVSENSDSTMKDSTVMPVDTTVKDTTKMPVMPPDTTVKPM
ncbi:coproporphyrinogen III oxidase [Pedobacter sp. PWIIR3]